MKQKFFWHCVVCGKQKSTYMKRDVRKTCGKKRCLKALQRKLCASIYSRWMKDE